MSNGVGFDVFDLGELPEFIDEIAIVPDLDLTAGTQVEVVFPGDRGRHRRNRAFSHWRAMRQLDNL